MYFPVQQVVRTSYPWLPIDYYHPPHLGGQVNDTFPRLTALALMGNPVWPALSSSKPRKAASTAGHSRRSLGEAERAGGHKSGGGEEEGGLGEEEAMFRIRVLRRLPGLQTLDCTDVTDEERLRASQARGRGVVFLFCFCRRRVANDTHDATTLVFRWTSCVRRTEFSSQSHTKFSKFSKGGV